MGDDALAAVQWAVRTRDDGPSLALSFDPGAVDDLPLMMRGADLVMGLLGLRGWRGRVPDLRVDVATDCDDQWWDPALRDLNADQRRAVIVEEDRTLIVAGAGTGKTHTMVAKAQDTVRTGIARPEEISFVRFTRKAAQETVRGVTAGARAVHRMSGMPPRQQLAARAQRARRHPGARRSSGGFVDANAHERECGAFTSTRLRQLNCVLPSDTGS